MVVSKGITLAASGSLPPTQQQIRLATFQRGTFGACISLILSVGARLTAIVPSTVSLSVHQFNRVEKGQVHCHEKAIEAAGIKKVENLAADKRVAPPTTVTVSAAPYVSALPMTISLSLVTNLQFY